MTPKDDLEPRNSGLRRWVIRGIGIVVVVAVLVIAYFILAAFIPRAWAQRVGTMVDGGFFAGTMWGLVIGSVCTFVPLLALMFAVLWFRIRGVGKVLAGLAVLVGLAFAVPNLMTLTVVLGNGSGAHAGQRIMDVEAPAFRGASLIGAIAAALVFLLVAAYVGKYKYRGMKIKRSRERERAERDNAEPAA